MFKILWQKSVDQLTTYTLYTVPVNRHTKCSLLKIFPSRWERKDRRYEIYTVKSWETPSVDNLFHIWILWERWDRIEFTGVMLGQWDMIIVKSVDAEITYQLFGEELDNTIETTYKNRLTSQISLNNYILAWNIIANVHCSCW